MAVTFRPEYFALWAMDQTDRQLRGQDYKEWFEHSDRLPFQHTYGNNADWIGEYIPRPRTVERFSSNTKNYLGQVLNAYFRIFLH